MGARCGAPASPRLTPRYYLKVLCRLMQRRTFPCRQLTSQNEVDTDQDGRMPACIWPQEYEIAFIREHLGPLLEASGVDTKIWILDRNYNLSGMRCVHAGG